MWLDHLKDRDGLEEYSKAMRCLATGPWAKQGGGRITWCVEVCKEYFVGGTLTKLIQKDLRRRGHSMTTLLPIELLPCSDADVAKAVEMFQRKTWNLLDVGSCYNPFNELECFEVTAIDIAPADSSVLSCDFLSITISESDTTIKGKDTLSHIKAASFDIVVFSLLLSYLPATEQRLKCCINAHKVLCLHGLLLIITPDSSHQNRHAGMMKSWKQSIESIGFHRWRYVKDTHLHCMAFRKTQVNVDYGGCLAEHHLLSIPQDSHSEFNDTEESISSDLPHVGNLHNQSDYNCSAQLMELPFSDNIDYCDDD